MAQDQGWLSRVKRADWVDEAAKATQQTAASNLKADALGDVKRLALATLGVGAAGRGAVGLYNMFKRNTRKRRPTGGPSLSLPYPVALKEAGIADFLGGANATTKAGIPWYGPAMMTAGIAGLAGGWKGVDHLLNKQRKRERDKELDTARQEFHDALISQYDRPLAGAGPTKAAAEQTAMEKVGADLDAIYDVFEKAATTLGDVAGQGAGMYGMYAGLTGLMAGALVYDKSRKRQRRAILEKAMQRRDRRKFNVSPPEIQAVPEPFHPAPKPVGDPTQAISLNTE